MQVRVKCSCGREFAADVFSASELVQCPDCGKGLPVDCVPAETSGAAWPQAQQAPTAMPAPTSDVSREPDASVAPDVASESGAPAEAPSPASPAPPPLPYSRLQALPWAAQRVGPTDSPGKPAAPPAPMAPPVYRGAFAVGPSPPVGLAVASMVCGIVSLVGCPMCFGPFALVGVLLGTAGAMLGIISLAKKRGGRGMAVSGVVTGVIGAVMALGAITFFAYAMWGAGTFTASSTTTGPAYAVSTTFPASGPATMPGNLLTGGRVIEERLPDVPIVMSGDQVADALTSPLDLPQDATSADIELRDALAVYPNRGRDPKLLSDCVRSFREYLAYAGLANPADAEHARMFRIACDELTDRVLTDYRQAGQFERDGKWLQAKQAYDEMMKYVPDPQGPLRENISLHSFWCACKDAQSRRKNAESPAGKPRPAS
jgi:hypothetical protein